ncbi:MAG: tyrosine-type recombinase/integrase [Chloroflexi bacterium]|nr:tyrosine-type recombinase/integrase [Chloroflexota bacterium]
MQAQLTYHQLVDEFVAEQPEWCERTCDWGRARLKPFVEFLSKEGITDPKAIEARHINRFLGILHKAKLSWSTRNGTYTVIRQFCRWMRRRRIIDDNPFSDPDNGLKRPRKVRKEIKPLPVRYMRQMIAATREDDSPIARRDEAIMYVLATTGVRREEIVELTFDKIDLECRTIQVRGKGGHERPAFLRDDTLVALQEWLDIRPATKAATVFVSMHPNKKGMYQPLEPDAINGLLIRWRNVAGLPNMSVSPHKWRHTFATYASRAGNPFALQILMGHSDMKTTKIYVHPDDDELRRVALDFGPEL